MTIVPMVVEPATMGIITGIGIVEIMGIVHMFESIITTSLQRRCEEWFGNSGDYPKMSLFQVSELLLIHTYACLFGWGT